MLELHDKRRCKCAEHVGNEKWQGSVSGWVYHKCDCGDCYRSYINYPVVKQSLSDNKRCSCVSHNGDELWHGSHSGYTRHYCKCGKCRAFWNEYNKEQYHAKLARREKARQRHLASYVPKKPAQPRKSSLVERRRKLWESQSGLCSLCNQPLAFEDAGLDHDHSCCDTEARKACGNCDRGALHHHCNSMLGFSGDNPDRLMQAVSYLLTNRDVLATI